MVLAFGPNTPVLLPDHTEYRGNQRWILWPTVQYRVVAPLVHEQRLNVFQNAVLGLARAGYREKAEIGDRLGLATELVDMVQTDLRQLAYLDRHGAVTPRGRAALNDGFLDPTRNIVTYVYQDPFTGSLWPASTVRPEFAPAKWDTRQYVSVQLRTAGAPLRVNALPVPVAADEQLSTDPPSHEQIVEAVSRGEKTRRQGRKNRRWTSAPPDRVVSRVSMITSGQPVYIPVVLRLEKKTEEGIDSVSWLANSPFTGQSSTYLRRLIATRSQRWTPLQKRIEQFVGHRSDALLAEYDLIDVAVRRQIAEVLEARFTIRLREHPELLELLTLLERDIRRVRLDNDRSAEVSDAVRNSWRIHETILRGVVARYPVPEAALDKISGPLWQHLGHCCKRLGLTFAQHVHLKVIDKRTKLASALRDPHRTTTPSLLAAAVVSADNGDADHPFRRLAGIRPQLLTDLTHLSGDRNTGSHATPVKLNREFGQTAWQLAQETTAAYLELPFPDLSRKESETHVEEGLG